jgi:hypothetical protein
MERTTIIAVGMLILLMFSFVGTPVQPYTPASVYNETLGVWETPEAAAVPDIRPTNVTPSLTQKVTPNGTLNVTPHIPVTPVTPNATPTVTRHATVVVPVTSITGPIEITQPGTYRVTADFTANETGIDVRSSGVIIEGDGHTISAEKEWTDEQVGVDANDYPVTVRNLTVVGFDIGMSGSIAATGCTFRDNGKGWQVLDERGDVWYSLFEENDVAISLENSGWCHIIGNRLIGNSEGIYIEPGIWTGGHVIIDNSFVNLNDASDITFSPVFSILENTFDRNFWGSPEGQGYSDLCTDINKDGICDAPYRLADRNSDPHPLKAPAIIESPVPPQPTPPVSPNLTPDAQIPAWQENRTAVPPGQENNLTPTRTANPAGGHAYHLPLTPNGTPNGAPVVSNVTPNVTPPVTANVTPNNSPSIVPTITPDVTLTVTPNVTDAANTTNMVDDTLGLVKESTNPFQVFENIPGLDLLHDMWDTIVNMAYWITYQYPEETIGSVKWFLGES